MRKKHFCFSARVCVVALLMFLFLSPLHAAPTKQLSYQGRLYTASGQPVTDGTYTIVFSIYNAATGGAPLWTETQNVSVANGGFSVYLGSVTALNLPFNEDYFLGMKVASDPEMTPRLKLSVVGASAYSLESEKLQGKAASDFALATHTHDTTYSTLAHTHTGLLTSSQLTQFNELTGGSATTLHTHTGLTATNADTVDNFHANATPTANTLLPLDNNAKFPASVVDTTGATNMVTQIVAGTNVTISPAGGTGIITVNAASPSGFVQLAPSSAQTIQATADVVPLIIKDDTSGTTANLLDVQDSTGTSLVKVNPSGNLLVGSPAITNAKISILNAASGTGVWSEISGASGYAGVFKSLNASNANEAVFVGYSGTGRAVWIDATNATSSGPVLRVTQAGLGRGGWFSISNASNNQAAVYAETNGNGAGIQGNSTSAAPGTRGTSNGTGNAGYFDIALSGNTSSVIFGKTIGPGALLQLQKSSVDQFVVGNNGKLTFSTGANKAVGAGTIAAATNTVTIANTTVTASSLIFLTINNTTGSVTMPLKIGTITAGTSFVVDTGDGTNAPAGGINFNYFILN